MPQVPVPMADSPATIQGLSLLCHGSGEGSVKSSLLVKPDLCIACIYRFIKVNFGISLNKSTVCFSGAL